MDYNRELHATKFSIEDIEGATLMFLDSKIVAKAPQTDDEKALWREMMEDATNRAFRCVRTKALEACKISKIDNTISKDQLANLHNTQLLLLSYILTQNIDELLEAFLNEKVSEGSVSIYLLHYMTVYNECADIICKDTSAYLEEVEGEDVKRSITMSGNNLLS